GALAAEVLEVGLEETALHGVLASEHWTQARQACALAQLGKVDDARRMLTRAVAAIGEGAGIRDRSPFVYLSQAAFDIGDLDQAEALCHDAIADAGQLGENWVVACCSLVLGRSMTARGADGSQPLARAAVLAREFGDGPIAETLAGMAHETAQEPANEPARQAL